MADRVNGFVVTFSEPLTPEHAEMVKQAILQLRQVVDVSPVPADISRDYVTRVQTLAEVQKKLNAALREVRGL